MILRRIGAQGESLRLGCVQRQARKQVTFGCLLNIGRPQVDNFELLRVWRPHNLVLSVTLESELRPEVPRTPFTGTIGELGTV
jgi:hypothetical protein